MWSVGCCGIRVGYWQGKENMCFLSFLNLFMSTLGSSLIKNIFIVNKLGMFYFSVFIILQDVYNQLIINISSRKRVIRHEDLIKLMTE